MPKLLSIKNKNFLLPIDKPEKELNKFICENWKDLFPNYDFISAEFTLEGNAGDKGGKVDIF